VVHFAKADLLTGYGWTTVNMMDSLQLLKREDSKSHSQQKSSENNNRSERQWQIRGRNLISLAEME